MTKKIISLLALVTLAFNSTALTPKHNTKIKSDETIVWNKDYFDNLKNTCLEIEEREELDNWEHREDITYPRSFWANYVNFRLSKYFIFILERVAAIAVQLEQISKLYAKTTVVSNCESFLKISSWLDRIELEIQKRPSRDITIFYSIVRHFGGIIENLCFQLGCDDLI